MVMALCLGSSEQIRSSKERGFDPRPPQASFAMCVYVDFFLQSVQFLYHTVFLLVSGLGVPIR